MPTTGATVGDIVNQQGDDIATSARFVRNRTNSTVAPLEPAHLGCCFLIRWGQMTTKQTVARLRERIDALVAAGVPVDVVVWRHPGETADEAIERYRREHPILATMPSATTTFHVVSWEG